MKSLKEIFSGMFDYQTDWAMLRNMHDKRI